MMPINHCWYWQVGKQCGFIHADSALQAKQLLAQHKINSAAVKPLSAHKLKGYKPRLSLWYELLQQVSDLLSSGLPLAEALRHSVCESPSRGLRWMVEDCIRCIERGLAFSRALQLYKNWLPEEDIIAIAWAEQTGQLAHTLHQLHQVAKRQMLLKKQMSKALRYPVIVLLVAGAVCFMMMGWVLPSFAPLFSEGELPWLTRTLLNASGFLRKQAVSLLGLILILSALLYIVRKQAPLFWQRTLSQLPFIGQLLEDIKLQQLFHRLAVALKAGIETRKALNSTAHSLTWLPHRHALRSVQQSVEQGNGWVDSFRASPLSEPRTLSFLKVAEQNGNVDQAFATLADIRQQRFEQNCERLIGLAEPLLMVILGGIIGTLLVAMYLPLFSMGQQF
ncbi:MAG: Type II secretory pathway, PulF-like protein [Idiomarina sp.]|nr:Type II secretory pathway, PulF-like protein [Idiomarina sp.]